MERSFNFGLSDVRSVLKRLVRPIQFVAGISGPEQRSTEASSGGGESVRDVGNAKASRPPFAFKSTEHDCTLTR